MCSRYIGIALFVLLSSLRKSRRTHTSMHSAEEAARDFGSKTNSDRMKEKYSTIDRDQHDDNTCDHNFAFYTRRKLSIRRLLTNRSNHTMWHVVLISLTNSLKDLTTAAQMWPSSLLSLSTPIVKYTRQRQAHVFDIFFLHSSSQQNEKEYAEKEKNGKNPSSPDEMMLQ